MSWRKREMRDWKRNYCKRELKKEERSTRKDRKKGEKEFRVTEGM